MNAVRGHEVANKSLVIAVVGKVPALAKLVERLLAPCAVARKIASIKVGQIEHPRIGDLAKLPHPINCKLVNGGDTVITWRNCIQQC